MIATDVSETQKARRAPGSEALQQRICAAFEGLEDAQDAGRSPGSLRAASERKATLRGEDGGGGGWP